MLQLSPKNHTLSNKFLWCYYSSSVQWVLSRISTDVPIGYSPYFAHSSTGTPRTLVSHGPCDGYALCTQHTWWAPNTELMPCRKFSSTFVLHLHRSVLSSPKETASAQHTIFELKTTCKKISSCKMYSTYMTLTQHNVCTTLPWLSFRVEVKRCLKLSKFLLA